MRRTTVQSLLIVTAFVATAGLASAGCKGKSGSSDKKAAAKKKGRVGSCDLSKTSSVCREYSEDNFIAGVDHLKKLCEMGKGKFKLEPCPKDNQVGRCVTPEGTKVYYTTGVLKPTAAKAKKWCTEGLPKGKWEPAK